MIRINEKHIIFPIEKNILSELQPPPPTHLPLAQGTAVRGGSAPQHQGDHLRGTLESLYCTTIYF